MIPDIAYLILNYNPAGEQKATGILGTVLDTFYNRKSRNLSCDVFLLDQGSPEIHRKWIVDKQNQYGFSTILLNRNIGISRAINLFVRTCKSPVLGLITSDVLITTGMDEDLFSKVQIPEVYQATPFTDKSDVDYQMWQPREEFGADHLDLTDLKKTKISLLEKLINKEKKSYLRYIGVEFNVMFWRRAIFDEIGYFDEQWKACYENNDFSLRCFLAGGCTALSLNSFVWHYHKVTEKNRSRRQCFTHYGNDWAQKMRRMWDDKWPGLNNYIDIYKPLKDKNISHYPKLYEQFKKNIYLSYEQDIDYF
ncbi:MAG: glycosyltransferase [Deltaproteobacteria bacterium]|nr:glycosyltransferase [Deltaproteobacteria bacterium]